MTATELIDRVMRAPHFNALYPPEDENLNFREILKMIHPDKCKHPMAQEATNHLLAIHRHFTHGSEFADDAGGFLCNDYWVNYMGEPVLIDHGRKMQREIAGLATEHLRRYMPYTWDTVCSLLMEKRAIPLVNLTLPQEHVNWVLSRLLEFCMLLHRHTGRAHLGLTPGQVLLVPETHGIAVAGFYHITPLGGRVKTISGAFRHWYPSTLLTDKKATENADLEMVKRIGAYLLGDRSGLGTSLLKTHHRGFIEFLLSSDDDSLACYEKYRAILDQNFPSQFIHLNI